ncbi:hypothetical protein BU15DRAFT_63806 [Melanogaster broomeanus]|nr:hypothetical protein BU15DRAFT_63806 [Melanogaster broomeanus]
MSSFRSFIEKTVHLQCLFTIHWSFLALPRFRTPTPVLIAVVVFTSLPIVGRGSSAPVSALATTLGKTLVKSRSGSIPILSAFFNVLVRALNSSCLRVRIHVRLPLQLWQMFHSGTERPRNYDTYPTPRAEATYWRVSGRYRRRLYSGDGTTSVAAPNYITSVVEWLLPRYRDHHDRKRESRETDADAQECWISPKTFCKWHRMVFEGPVSPVSSCGLVTASICSCHPTLAQAAAQMKYYSNRDLREIRRIARLVPDEQVFLLENGIGRRNGRPDIAICGKVGLITRVWIW